MLGPTEQLEAAERQLLVFAREINQLHRAERARAAELDAALARLEGSHLDTVRTLAFVVEAKDSATRAHLERTHEYAVALTQAVAPELAGNRGLRYGFLLHDIGKLGVPEAVLTKAGPLDPHEWEAMRAHPLLGVRIVAGLPFLGGGVDVIRSHHERWDGCGYPFGLRAEAIPLGARIFSLCDAFDAMTSDRPYRRALPPSTRSRRSGPGPAPSSTPRWWRRSCRSRPACSTCTPACTRPGTAPWRSRPGRNSLRGS